MAIKHSITLSTTEPNNEVGVIKIRQADEQTQTLEVQITENGVPKSYQGLAVYFCAKLGQTAGLGIIEQKLKVEEMTNPANGKLEYTMRAEDWQILGRQKGYFSFRKMKDEHEFVEQFTTRDFTFEVIKSVFSEGVKEVKKDGSTYVWTIEDLIRLFNEYMASGKSDWEEFVEQNREMLESVDPGGLLLSELIRSRKPAGADVPYKDVPERLDKQIGLNSDFREFEADESFMKRVYNEQSERGVNVKWFGAKGDGVTDDTLAIQNAVDFAARFKLKTFVPDGLYMIKAHVDEQPVYPKYLENRGGILLPSDTHLVLSTNTILKEVENRQRASNVLRTYLSKNVKIEGGIVQGFEGVVGGNEWHYGLAIQGGANVKVIGTTFIDFLGDGIDIQRASIYDAVDFIPKNVFIDKVTCLRNSRQGLSIEEVDGCYVTNSVFSETNGTAPQSGIDIEPAYHNKHDKSFCQNIWITGCRFENNAGNGLQMPGFNIVKNVHISNNVFKNNKSGAIEGSVRLSSAEFVTFANNKLINDILSASGLTNSDIKDNIFLDGGFYSKWGGLRGSSLTGNTFKHTKLTRNTYSIYIEGGEADFVRFAIENNEFYGLLDNPNTLYPFDFDAIRIVSAKEIPIKENRFIGYKFHIRQDLNNTNAKTLNMAILKNHFQSSQAQSILANAKYVILDDNLFVGCCYVLSKSNGLSRDVQVTASQQMELVFTNNRSMKKPINAELEYVSSISDNYLLHITGAFTNESKVTGFNNFADSLVSNLYSGGTNDKYSLSSTGASLKVIHRALPNYSSFTIGDIVLILEDNSLGYISQTKQFVKMAKQV